MRKLVEYRIETESSLKKVYLMWKRYFFNDPWWHFCLEGSYIEIRLSKRNHELEEYIEKKKWKYLRFPYVDNVDITRQYQENYQYIFHGYAEIIMQIMDKYKEEKRLQKERGDTIERCIHLNFNIFGVNNVEEAEWLSRYVVGRARFAGYHEGYHKAKEEQDADKKSKVDSKR